MTSRKQSTAEGPKPNLEPGMHLADFTDYYWLKADLVRFAKQLGLPTDGYKPELSARIERASQYNLG